MKRIPLSQGKYAIVDDPDYKWLNQWKWCLRNGYAVRNSKDCEGLSRKILSMHRVLIDAPSDKQVDHINRNRLDNRRLNLRLCNNSQNHANSVVRTKSGFKGVYFNKDKKAKPWKAEITVNNKPRFLGRFTTPEEAAIHYNVAAQIFFGSFARLNDV